MSVRLLPLLPVVLLAGCGDAGEPWPAGPPGPKVVASFPPLFSLAAAVGGPDVSVRSAMTGTGPHDFDPTADDMRRLRGADLFFVNGLGLDDRAAKKLVDGSRNRRLRLIDLGGKLPKALLEEGECRHDHGDGHKHEHGKDPHVWLGPDLAVKLVEGIRDELCAADPARAAGYQARAADTTARLNQLLADGKALLKNKRDRQLVTSHESLEYFARAFDLRVADVLATTPGKEPRAEELADLVSSCVAKKVRVIAVEPQYAAAGPAGRVREELARRGVPDPQVVEIDPLETARPSDLDAGWYERTMRANLQALAGALR